MSHSTCYMYFFGFTLSIEMTTKMTLITIVRDQIHTRMSLMMTLVIHQAGHQEVLHIHQDLGRYVTAVLTKKHLLLSMLGFDRIISQL